MTPPVSLPAHSIVTFHARIAARSMTVLTNMPPLVARTRAESRTRLHRGYGIVLGAIVLLAIGKETIDAVRLGSRRVASVDKVLPVNPKPRAAVRA